MPKWFEKLDKVKPVYDVTEKVLMCLCKILLIIDIVIAAYTVLGRYCTELSHKYAILAFLRVVKDPSWSEEVILSCMAYMAVLSAALALRHNAHIRMTAFDRYLPPVLVKSLDLLADVGVLVLAVIMLVVGWNYAVTLGARGTYVSMPWLSRFWMYLPVPIAGFFMIIFEIEAIYNHIKAFYIKESKEEKEEAV